MFFKKLKECLTGITALWLMAWTGAVHAEWGLNLTRGVTPISHEVYDLHMLILWVVTIIGIGVFSVMFWSILHHRKSKGAVSAKFHHSTTAEIVWTIIPILILVGMAIPATKTLIKMEQTGCRHDHQSHRLSMEMEIRLYGRWTQFLQCTRTRQQ